MGEIRYDKLVRDNIPDIIAAQGHRPVVRILEHGEYIERLCEKLIEEAAECANSPSIDELCDVFEVAEALMSAIGVSSEDVLAAKAQKAAKNGAFKKRLLLERVIER